MKKILLLAVLLSGTARLMAQNNLQPLSSVPDNSSLKLLKPIILDSATIAPMLKDLNKTQHYNPLSQINTLPNQQQFSALNRSLLVAGNYTNINHMPVAKLRGQSNMPVYKLEGNSKMPVLGANENKNMPAIKAIP
ncbi:hypothetical protein A0256_09040 [Mucilaginibacter sp. PAMC 26640]|nr:hypothetical protein A0256_09040 [Mucilaginibacter sp. PAMC 26640]